MVLTISQEGSNPIRIDLNENAKSAEAFSDIASKFKAGAQQFGQSISAGAQNAAGAVANGAQQFGQAVGNGASNIYHNATMKGVVNGIQNTANTVANGAQQFSSKYVAPTLNAAKNFGSNYLAPIGKATANATADSASRLYHDTGMDKKVDNFVANARKTGNNIATGAKNAIGSVQQFGSNYIAPITNATADSASRLYHDTGMDKKVDNFVANTKADAQQFGNNYVAPALDKAKNFGQNVGQNIANKANDIYENGTLAGGVNAAANGVGNAVQSGKDLISDIRSRFDNNQQPVANASPTPMMGMPTAAQQANNAYMQNQQIAKGQYMMGMPTAAQQANTAHVANNLSGAGIGPAQTV